MGDHVEPQITPETPGRPSIRNPFESPSDYHHLHEPLVPSPSVFKSKPNKATPAKFNWSIDEMASLLPVHIDPEDIQRQSLYLSQTRIDFEVEEKCQTAIEKFFTKEAIVPSPWANTATQIPTQSHNNKSPMSPVITEEPGKFSVACQTALSLPVTFDLEKIVGEYYHLEEVCDAVQESFSSSSLRRKLFLDGQASSDSENFSPERGHCRKQELLLGVGGRAVAEVDTPASIFSSPVSCPRVAPTPSTGQFSSSPIQQGYFRDHSMGSITSPVFPDRSSPACFASPAFSPVGSQATRTPLGERKQLSHLTPDGVSLPLDMDVSSCTVSPYVEGCSPILSCSPHHLHSNSHSLHNAKPRFRARYWVSPPLISPILNPKLHDDQEDEDQLLSACPHSNYPSNANPRLGWDRHNEGVARDHLEPVTEEGTETQTEGKLEDIGEEEEEGDTGRPSLHLTSSHVVNASSPESSRMFLSLLADGSSIRPDSSIQVDSGYTTSVGTASLMDGLSSDCLSKESLSSNPTDDAFLFARHTKTKVLYPLH
ncbi:protein aurora borealis [Lampris incognitus]|uniref:protein aurora borealis n=1 Tax=Lampris incognitus TaxID=2546036 RepID=UPI0024B59E82|nr:protein aurora borealis [Lampris incognitus]